MSGRKPGVVQHTTPYGRTELLPIIVESDLVSDPSYIGFNYAAFWHRTPQRPPTIERAVAYPSADDAARAGERYVAAYRRANFGSLADLEAIFQDDTRFYPVVAYFYSES